MRARSVSACVFVLVFGGILSACGSCNDKALSTDGLTDGGHHTSGELTPEEQAKVLAKVGDKTITLGDFVASLENMDQFDRLRYQSPERRKELLNELINVELLAQEARAKGYDKDPAAEQEIRQILRDAMLADARKHAPTPNDIPEADARAYYDAHRDEYIEPERRRLSVIVTKDEASAKEVIAAAEKGLTSAQWGELVKAKSIDPQAKANVPIDLVGDVGIVSPPGDSRGENPRVPEEVRVAAYELTKPGDIMGHPIEVKGKYYVVRFTQKMDPHNRPFEEAERTIRLKLAQDKMRAKENELLGALKKQYPVQIDEAALATVHVDLADAGGYPNTPPMAFDGSAPHSTLRDLREQQRDQ